jgi:hypothetical protein
MSLKKEAVRRNDVPVVLTGVALLILFQSAGAQGPPKPGKEHDHLKRLVGTWEVDSEFGNGTMTYKMGLDGLWLVGDFDGEFGGMKFKGHGLDTYDSATKKYRSVWVDTFSAKPRIMDGTLDKDEKVMTLTGEGRGRNGATATYKSITEIKDANTFEFALFMLDKDGKDQLLVKITYKRKKETAPQRVSFPGVQGKLAVVAQPLEQKLNLKEQS